MSGHLRKTSALAGVFAAAALAGSGVAPSSAAPEPASAEAPPVLGQRETLTPVAGSVAVRIAGTPRFVRLAHTLAVPDGSEVDARRGRVDVTVATVQPGQTATALVYQGLFRIHQQPQPPAETHLVLSQPLSGCTLASAGAHAAAHRRAHAAAHRRAHAGARTRARDAAHHHSSKSRQLWVSENGGNWGTGGRYASTTVEGTRWLTIDECQRSEVRVAAGVVVVHDLIRHTSTTVTAGQRYVAAAPVVESSALVPPRGEVYSGVTGGSPGAFQRQVGKHPAIFGYFANWGEMLGQQIDEARAARARLFVHISTDVGYGGGARETISPGAIAHGAGDGYLIALGAQLAGSGRPAYIALLPEMNQANNAYCAFNADGSARDAHHSTAAYRQAWRRSVLVLRGGPVATIDRRLRALGLPAVRTPQATLARPRVAFMWAPQTAGTPEVAANEPAAYYPGAPYVDIVGTDFYSAFPNFAGLTRLYAHYPSKPFGFNEWAMWRSGAPAFVAELFAFVRTHRRVGVMLYNQGLNPEGPFRLKHFPAATAEIRRQLASPRYPAYTPEWRGG